MIQLSEMLVEVIFIGSVLPIIWSKYILDQSISLQNECIDVNTFSFSEEM